MDDKATRLKCLELATTLLGNTQAGRGNPADTAIEISTKLCEYVNGSSQEAPPCQPRRGRKPKGEPAAQGDNSVLD